VATADGGILKTRTVAVETAAAAAAIGTERQRITGDLGLRRGHGRIGVWSRPLPGLLGFFDRFIRPRFSTIRFGRLNFHEKITVTHTHFVQFVSCVF
jgi:hypothetical protein